MSEQELKDRIEKATEEGLFAFWQEIVNHFPTATSGDFPPDLDFEMTLTMEKMVNYWLSFNDPTYPQEAE